MRDSVHTIEPSLRRSPRAVNLRKRDVVHLVREQGFGLDGVFDPLRIVIDAAEYPVAEVHKLHARCAQVSSGPLEDAARVLAAQESTACA